MMLWCLILGGFVLILIAVSAWQITNPSLVDHVIYDSNRDKTVLFSTFQGGCVIGTNNINSGGRVWIPARYRYQRLKGRRVRISLSDGTRYDLERQKDKNNVYMDTDGAVTMLRVFNKDGSGHDGNFDKTVITIDTWTNFPYHKFMFSRDSNELFLWKRGDVCPHVAKTTIEDTARNGESLCVSFFNNNVHMCIYPEEKQMVWMENGQHHHYNISWITSAFGRP